MARPYGRPRLQKPTTCSASDSSRTDAHGGGHDGAAHSLSHSAQLRLPMRRRCGDDHIRCYHHTDPCIPHTIVCSAHRSIFLDCPRLFLSLPLPYSLGGSRVAALVPRAGMRYELRAFTRDTQRAAHPAALSTALKQRGVVSPLLAVGQIVKASPKSRQIILPSVSPSRHLTRHHRRASVPQRAT